MEKITKEQILKELHESDLDDFAKEKGFTLLAAQNFKTFFHRVAEIKGSRLYRLFCLCNCGCVDESFVLFQDDKPPKVIQDAIDEGRYPKAICGRRNEIAVYCFRAGLDIKLVESIVPGLNDNGACKTFRD
jgi:hypothetical protein